MANRGAYLLEMAASEELEVALHSLRKSRAHIESGNFGRAFAHYLVCLTLLPSRRNSLKEEFLEVLCTWTNILESRKQYKQVFSCFESSLLYFPGCPKIHNHMGSCFYRLDMAWKARNHFQLALKKNPNYLPAEKNMESMNNYLVENWHFRMLNDFKRNYFYRLAIHRRILEGCSRVLDIGTGTGILSLFAAEQKVDSLVACDHSETMVSIAEEVFVLNEAENIELLHKSSQALQPTDGRFSLVITETVDVGVFGEKIIQNLIHAWDHLLLPFPAGKVIPSAVDVYVSAFQSESLAKRHRVAGHADLFGNLVVVNADNKPYDSCNMKKAKCEAMTEPQLAFSINFNDVQELNEVWRRVVDLPIVPSCDMLLDGFVLHFVLHLDEHTSLTNSHLEDYDSCWDQAIFFADQQLPLKKGQRTDFVISRSPDGLQIVPKLKPDQGEIYRASNDVVLMLNDSDLIRCLDAAAGSLPMQTPSAVLDLSPFPYLGLKLAAAGANLVTPSSEIEHLIRSVAKAKGIPVQKVRIISSYADSFSTTAKFDVIHLGVLNSYGMTDVEALQRLSVLKVYLSERGVMLPRDVRMLGQLIESPYLTALNRVDDENTCGFHIAESINKYKTSEHFEIDPTYLPHKPLSESFRFGTVLRNNAKSTVTKHRVTVKADGEITACLYWYEAVYGEAETEAKDAGGVWSSRSQAAVIFDEVMSVRRKDRVTVHLHTQDHFAKILLG